MHDMTIRVTCSDENMKVQAVLKFQGTWNKKRSIETVRMQSLNQLEKKKMKRLNLSRRL